MLGSLERRSRPRPDELGALRRDLNMKRIATLEHDQHALRPDFQFSMLIDGKAVREPERLTDVGLRYTLIMEYDFREEDVNLICARAERNGRCRVRFDGEKQVYVIERIMAS